MPSSEVKPNYGRRFMWLAVFVVILFGGYSAGWYYLADRVTREANAAIASLNRDGVTAECANPVVRGYPFRLGLYCDSLGYADPSRNIVATAGSLSTAGAGVSAAALRRRTPRSAAHGTPGMPPLWLDWDNLRASARLARPLPRLVSVEAEGFPARPIRRRRAGLFSATRIEGHLRPNGTDLDWAGNFAGLR